MMTIPFPAILGLALALASVGCNKAPNAASAQTNAAPSAPIVAAAAPKVTKIVFVGKEHACDCTRKTVEAGWGALQQALGTPAKLPVERLQVDTQADQVAPYRQQKPMMALPAIYFVDGKSVVLDLLQGEVTAEQIGTVIAR